MPVEDVDQPHQVLHPQGGDRQVVRFQLGHVEEHRVRVDRQPADVQRGKTSALGTSFLTQV